MTQAGRSPDMSSDFGERLRLSHRALWLVASSVVRDSALADDVLQEAAMIGFRKFGEFEPGTSFVSWMARIVRYVALNHGRKQRRQRERLRGLMDGDGSRMTQGEAASMDGVERVMWSEHVSEDTAVHWNSPLPSGDLFDQRICRALAAVSDAARVCLLLRVVDGMEYSEIANLLGIPRGTAMSHVHRTRLLLREKLSDLDPSAVEPKETSL